MDLKVKYQGIEATFTVGSHAEGIELLKMLAATSDSKASNDEPRAVVAPPVQLSAAVRESSEQVPVTDAVVSEILHALKGSQSAKVLKAMSEATDGITDMRLREVIGEDGNFGPIFAHVSKVCKRAGVTTAAIYSSVSKRSQNGKLLYKYRINPQASRILRTIPDFETNTSFEGF